MYQPFAWVVWGWHNSTSQDQRIRQAAVRRRNDRLRRQLPLRGIFFVAREPASAQAHPRTRRTCMARRDGHRGGHRDDRPHAQSPQASTSAAGVATDSRRLHYLRHNGPEHILALRRPAPAKASASSFRRCSRGASRRHLRHQGRELGQDGRLPRAAAAICASSSRRSKTGTVFAVQSAAEVRLFTPRDVRCPEYRRT